MHTCIYTVTVCSHCIHVPSESSGGASELFLGPIKWYICTPHDSAGQQCPMLIKLTCMHTHAYNRCSITLSIIICLTELVLWAWSREGDSEPSQKAQEQDVDDNVEQKEWK